MKFYMEPVDKYTPAWGLVFGSVASAYIRARSLFEYSPETRIEFAKLFIPSFFYVRKELAFNAFFLGTCWTISRLVTEKGIIATGNKLSDPNDLSRKRKIEACAITASVYLSSFISCGSLFLAQKHFSKIEQNLKLDILFETAINITNCFVLGFIATKIFGNR